MTADADLLETLKRVMNHTAFRQYPHSTQQRVEELKRRVEQRLAQKEEQHGEG